MCCGDTGTPFPYEDISPPEIKALRAKIANTLSTQVGKTATPYLGKGESALGKLYAPYDPATMAGGNLLFSMMGMGNYNPWLPGIGQNYAGGITPIGGGSGGGNPPPFPVPPIPPDPDPGPGPQPGPPGPDREYGHGGRGPFGGDPYAARRRQKK